MCPFPHLALNVKGLATTFRKRHRLLHHCECLGEVLARVYPPGRLISYIVHSLLVSNVCKPALGISHVIVKNLCIPPRSPHAYFIHLMTAFSISAFFHFLSLSVICEGYVEPTTLAVNMGLFFMVQPFGTMVEHAVIQLCHGTRWSESLISRTDSENSILGGVPRVLVRLLGYAWVFCWFTWTGWWFVEVYAAIGVLEWPMPFSLWAIRNKGV